MNVRTISAGALALAFLAMSGGVALAQDRGQNRGQNRRPDSTRGRPDTTPAAPTPAAPTPAPQLDPKAQAEQDRRDLDANRRVLQGGQGRQPAQTEQDRRAAQAEQDRRDAQGRSNNNDQDRSNRNGQDRSYNGQDRGQDRSYNGQDRRYPQGGEPTFTDRDREVTRNWYRQNRNRLGAGWGGDPAMEGRIRRGERLDPTLRQQMHWLPPDLAQMYGPPPRGYRYAIIGGNIVLIDDWYQMHDVFSLDFQTPGQGWNGQSGWRNGDGFTDRDRQVTREWYRQHRNRLGAGWRDQDRLPPYLEGRLRRGQRLDPVLRQRMYWLPPDLAAMYGPPPRGYRYAIIGGNIVLIDDGYQVHDVFRLEFNF